MKIKLALIILLIPSISFAQGFGNLYINRAKQLKTDSQNFGNFLPTSATTVQSALDYINANAGTGGGGYATIQDETVTLTQRTKVNFTGTGITCVDNAGNTRTDCTVPGGAGTPAGGLGAVQYNNVAFAGDETKVSINPSGNLGIGTTNANPKLFINGNVGIGTTVEYITASPAAGGLLIQGNVAIGTPDTTLFGTSGKLAVVSLASGSDINPQILAINLNGNNDAQVSSINQPTSGGNGAARLTSENDQSHVFITALTNGTTGGAAAGIGTGSQAEVLFNGSGATDAILNASVNIPMHFATNNIERMTIAREGNVGIGTFGPVQKLEVNGSIKVDTAPTLCAAGNYPLGIDNNLNSTGCTPAGGGSSQWITTSLVGISTVSSVGIGTTTTNQGGGLIVTNGNIGIGTWTPGSTLTVNGNVGINTMIAPNAIYMVGEARIIGNVGIGTAAATHNLEVPGSAQFGGTVNMSSPTINNVATTGVIGTGNIVLSANQTLTGTLTAATANFSANVRAPSYTFVNNGNTQGVLSACSANTPTSGSALIIPNTGSSVGQKMGLNVDFNANVGIGTSGPNNNPLMVVGNVGIGTVSSMIALNPCVGNLCTEGNIAIGTYSAQTRFSVIGGNVGIGTWTAPGGILIIPSGNVGIGSIAPQSSLVIGGNGMIGSSGTAPTVVSNDCGSTTQGTVSAGSTDMRGDVVVGTLAVTSCKVTLNKSHSTLRCIPTDDTSLLTIRSTETANTITFISTSSASGDTITWHCDE